MIKHACYGNAHDKFTVRYHHEDYFMGMEKYISRHVGLMGMFQMLTQN